MGRWAGMLWQGRWLNSAKTFSLKMKKFPPRASSASSKRSGPPLSWSSKASNFTENWRRSPSSTKPSTWSDRSSNGPNKPWDQFGRYTSKKPPTSCSRFINPTSFCLGHIQPWSETLGLTLSKTRSRSFPLSRDPRRSSWWGQTKRSITISSRAKRICA